MDLKGAGAQETARTDILRGGGAVGGPSQCSIGCCIAVWFFQRKGLDASRCRRLIYRDDARPDHRDAPSARHSAAGDRRASARLAVRADRAPHQRLHDLRRRRRAPTVGSDHQLCRWPCSPATLTRQLARLRRLHVIKRVAGTYRYYLTRTGRAAIAAGCRLTEHTIIPALA